jgi:hypothetical protein
VTDQTRARQDGVRCPVSDGCGAGVALAGIQMSRASLPTWLPCVFAIAATWGYTWLLARFDLGWGWLRAVLLAAGAGFLLVLRRSRPHWRPGTSPVAVFAIGALLAGVHLRAAVQATTSGRAPVIDIGATTIAAVHLAAEGRSVYRAPIDPTGGRDSAGGSRTFFGFKYGPAMIAIYAPGVRLAGARGYFLTNALFLAFLVVAAGAWAAREGGREGAILAVALTLSAAHVPRQLFSEGVNDVVPMALALAAFALHAWAWPAAAGAFIGLSFGTKLLPAALLAVLLIVETRDHRDRLRLLSGFVALVALCYLPSVAVAPTEVFSNLIGYQVSRGPDSTSALYFVPATLRGPVQVVLGVMLLSLVWWRARAFRPPGETGTATVAVAAVTLLLVGSPIVHTNYLMWLHPLWAVALATGLSSRRFAEHRNDMAGIFGKIKSRADFFRELELARKDVSRLLERLPHADTLRSISRQLDTIEKWTANGRTPTKKERTSLDMGLRMFREYEMTDDEEIATFRGRVAGIHSYIELWPTDRMASDPNNAEYFDDDP